MTPIVRNRLLALSAILSSNFDRVSRLSAYSEYATYTSPKLRTLSTLSSIFIPLNTDWISWGVGGLVGLDFLRGKRAAGPNRWKQNGERTSFYFIFFFLKKKKISNFVVTFLVVLPRTARDVREYGFRTLTRVITMVGGRRKTCVRNESGSSPVVPLRGGATTKTCKHWKDHVCFLYTYLVNCLLRYTVNNCSTIVLLVVSYTWKRLFNCNRKPWRRHPLSGLSYSYLIPFTVQFRQMLFIQYVFI